MDAIFWVNVLSRWLHVASAVVLVGGLVFLGVALLPGMAGQDAAVRQAAMGPVVRRFKILVHSAIGLLLLTGFYNFMVVLPKARTLVYHSLYQSVLGTKILLALVLFGIAFPLLSSPPTFGNMEAGRRRWVTVLMLLGLVILLFFSVLRRLWDFR
jgi:putative copper export protein